MVNRHVIGAHYGIGGWLIQRLSAVVMAVYTVILAVALFAHPPRDHASWKALFSMGWMRVATLLFLVSLLLHAWVGMRDILMDYVKPTGLRLTLMTAVAAILVVYLIWSASILWGVHA